MADTQQGFEQDARRVADAEREVQDQVEAKEKRSFQSAQADVRRPVLQGF